MELKTLIVPLQRWLLSQKRCVGCGRSLEKGKRRVKNGIILVTCSCRRIFVYKPKGNSYRRALR